MAFDFPTGPAINDEYTSGGITYVWTGTTWDIFGGGDLSDYVLKAGDTMTGALIIDSVPLGSLFILNNPAGTFNNRLEGRKTGITRWSLDLGSSVAENASNAGSDFVIYRYANNGTTWNKAMQINRADGYMTLGSGLGFGSFAFDATTDLKNLSRHIALYGTTFGFSVTGSTLNYHVSAGSKHDFHVDGVNKFSIQATTSYLNTNLTMTGLLTVNTGIALSSAYLSCPEGSKIQFNSASMFISSTANKNIRYDVGDTAEHGMWVNGTKEFWVSSAGHGLRMPDSFATGLGVTRDDDGGVNMRETLIALLAKIKSMEAEIKTLKARK